MESLDYALFRYENTGKTKKYYPCQIVPVGPGYLQSSEAFAMVKGSHLDEVFSNQILKIQVLSQLKKKSTSTEEYFYFHDFSNLSNYIWCMYKLSKINFSDISQERGILDHIINKWVTIITDDCSNDDLRLGYNEMFSIFLLLAVGLLISLVVFSAEGTLWYSISQLLMSFQGQDLISKVFRHYLRMQCPFCRH